MRFQKKPDIILLANVKYADDLIKAYKTLAKKYHPDVNPEGQETFKQLVNEYEWLLEHLPKRPKEGEAAGATMSAKEVELDKKLRDIIDRLINLDGLNIEVCGTWIWVDGNSYPHRETLKALNFQWSKPRKKWHFTPYATTGYRKGKRYDFDTIRAIHGSIKVDSEPTIARIAG